MSDQYILGISAFYHDSAACLLRNGEIVAAGAGRALHAQEGRRDFPAPGRRLLPASRRASRWRMSSYVGFYDKPLLKFERILETYLGVAPRGFRSFLMAGPLWIKDKLYIDRQLQRGARLRRPDPLRRAPRVARRQRVLPVAVRGGGDPHDRRRRRVGDGVDRRRPRQRHRDPRGAALARLARPALLRVHLLHRASRSTPASTR